MPVGQTGAQSALNMTCLSEASTQGTALETNSGAASYLTGVQTMIHVIFPDRRPGGYWGVRPTCAKPKLGPHQELWDTEHKCKNPLHKA